MKIYYDKTDTTTEHKFFGPVSELLAKIGINIEEVLVVRGGTLLAETTIVEDTDSLKILSVVSGG